MPTHLALLRGVNVGGRHLVTMPTLRELLTGLGHTDVVTYIQSGNAVFTPQSSAPPEELARQVGTAIQERCGFTPVVVVRTAEEWAGIVEADPYPGDTDPRQVHLAPRQESVVEQERVVLLDLLRAHQDSGGPDHLTVTGTTVYVHTPDGMGRSRLAARLSAAPGTGQERATARNRRTAQRLLQMLRS